MVATGALSLIEDIELRAALVDFYARTASLEARFVSLMPNYPLFVHGFTPAELRDDGTEADQRAFGFARAVEAFRSPEFQEIHGREYNYALYIQRQVGTVERDVMELWEQVRCVRGVAEACKD